VASRWAAILRENQKTIAESRASARVMTPNRRAADILAQMHAENPRHRSFKTGYGRHKP
jgi:hypothetical protein